MAYKRFGALSSSMDPNELSMTVRGILTGILPIVLLIARSQGLEFGEGEAQELIDAIVNVTVAIGGAVAALVTAYGVFRKVVARFADRTR